MRVFPVLFVFVSLLFNPHEGCIKLFFEFAAMQHIVVRRAAELVRAKVPQPSFYLLRPDGHVGLCGVRLEITDVKRYLAEQVRLKAQGGLSNGNQPSSGATVTPVT